MPLSCSLWTATAKSIRGKEEEEKKQEISQRQLLKVVLLIHAFMCMYYAPTAAAVHQEA